MDYIRRHKLIITTVVIQLIVLPLILFAVKKQQDVRTRAAASTTLAFSPASDTTSPLNENLGQDFSVDVTVNPGTNLISLAKIEIKYDPTKVTLSSTNPVVVNNLIFPQIVEGPVYTPGNIRMVVSIGPDQTKVVQTQSKVMTINFHAAATASPTSLTFGSITALYSTAPQDSSNENVLSSTLPAFIKINAAPTPTFTPVPTNSPTPTPTLTPTPTPTPTPKPTATPTPTPTPTATPTPKPTAVPTNSPTATPTLGKTTLSLNGLKLHGIGKGGDTPNPTSLGTQNPLHPTRSLTVEIYNTSGTLLNSIPGNLIYNSTGGNFSGSVDLPTSLTNANYIVKIKTPQYLRRQLPGFLALVQGQANLLPSASLIAGDVNGDNSLSVADYTIIMDCYSDLLPAKNCDATKKLSADLSDDGKVDQDDYNLFLRELSIQQGE